MARDASGNFTGPSNTVNPAAAGTTIDPTDFNDLVDDIESAFSESHFTAATSGTDNAVIRNDGTGGRKLQASAVTIDDSGNLAGVGTVNTKALPTGDFVGTSDTQTLTNKTLTAPVINVGSDAQGDVYFRNSSGVFSRLAPGTAGQLLRTGGAGADPAWTTGVSVDGSNNLSGVVNLSATGYIDITEMSAPPNPSANVIRLYVVDNGGTSEMLFKDSAGTVYNLTSIAAASGTVTSVDITPPAAGITSSGGPVTSSGSISLSLANDLAAVEGLSGSGLAARTGSDTWSTRTITAGSGITVSNGDGVSGNPTIALDFSALSGTSGAAGILAGEEGIALDFVSRTYAIEDYDDILSDAGRIDDLLTISRASSATYVGRDRLLKTASSNVLRYDHDPATGVPLGALIEGARTNVLKHSNEMDNAGQWLTPVGGSVTADQSVGWDGGTNLDRFTEDTSTGLHTTLSSNVSAVAKNAVLTLSYVIRFGSGSRNIVLQLNGYGGNSARISVQPGTLAITSDTSGEGVVFSSGIIDLGGGLYRVWFSGRCKTSDTATGVQASLSLYSGTNASYAGDGTSSVFLGYAQLEEGSHASSYIATTTAAATRAADSVSVATSVFPVDATQGTIFLEFVTFDVAPLGFETPIAIGTNDSNAVGVQIRATDKVGMRVYVGGVSQADTSSVASFVANTAHKVALKYRSNEFASSFDGEAAVTDSSGTVPSVSLLSIGSNVQGTAPLWGRILACAYYNRAMTATELAGLTA